jgi:tetratricopeptide (TPR) repeat protein
MSLLMKALEKAAKDRGDSQTEAKAAPGAADGKPELSLALELLAADTPSPQMQEDAPASGKDGGRRAAAAAPASPREQARAATVVRASAASGGAGAWLRGHPLVAFGVTAALFAAGFAAYVYLQINHPGVFTRRPPPPPPLAQTPAPQPAPSAAPAPAQPIATAPLLDAIAQEAQPAAPAPAPPEERARPAAPKPKAAASAPAAAAKPAPAPEAPRSGIVVTRGGAEPAVNPLLASAYAELQAGRYESAAGLYERLLKSEPMNIDALLGLAAIAAQAGRAEEATRHYMRILELDPRHALAQSGLIGLLGRAEPLAAETRLKQLIAREPSAFLFFTLGNLYADQSLWAQAQQAYFQAHHLEPGNPDYAYNLAVGLEHLSQPRLALEFYRRALALASQRGRANFDTVRAGERIARLAAQVE